MYWSQNHEDNPENGLYYTWSQSSGNSEVLVFKDNLDRDLRSITRNVYDSKIYKDIEYNSFGQKQKESNSHFASGNILWTEYEYLATGQVKKITSPTSEITYNYQGKITKSTTQNPNNNNDNIITYQELNSIGQTIKVTDAIETINYTYYSSGNMKNISTSGNLITLTYDEAGRQKTLLDPSAGTTSYIYNAFGELISQTDANSNTYKMEYDGFGRIFKKHLVGDEFDVINYVYNTPTNSDNGIGLIKQISLQNGAKSEFEYDNLGRTIKKTRTIDEINYVYTFEYNISGKSRKQTWPSGFEIDYRYKNGFLSSIQQSSTGETIWELASINAQGQITQYELGNGLLTTKEYDTYGLPVSITTNNNVQQNNYSFNNFTGNLEWRSSVIYPPYGSHTLREDFTYDDDKLKNRLKTWSVQQVVFGEISYLDNGNINSKTGIGTYDYSVTPKPYAVDRITNPESDFLNKVKENDHHINYTGFNKISKIWASVNNDDPSTLIKFTYYTNRKRCKTELYNNGELIKTKLFVSGDYEIEIDAMNNTKELHYIGCPDGLFAIFVSENSDEGSMKYIHKDYLGSYEVITNETGNVVERLSFDPWGRRRNPTNWSYESIPENFIFDRGYTGHEHIAEFELINMNGRVYDPFISRFLSPDNFVQSAGYSQNYNRYSYCLNNPLKYTDPSGELVWIPIAIGAVIGGYQGYRTGQKLGYSGMDLFWSAGQGSVSGALSAYLGGLASSPGAGAALAINNSGIFRGAAIGLVTGAITGGLNGGFSNALAGNDFWEGFKNGATTGGISGMVAGGFNGYQLAKKRGLNPWTGASKKGSNKAIYIYLKSKGKQGAYPRDLYDNLTNKIRNGTAKPYEFRKWERITERITMSMGKYTYNNKEIIDNFVLEPKYYKDNFDIYYNGSLETRNQEFQISINNGENNYSITPNSYKWNVLSINNAKSIRFAITGPDFNANYLNNDFSNSVVVVPNLEVRVVGYRYF